MMAAERALVGVTSQEAQKGAPLELIDSDNVYVREGIDSTAHGQDPPTQLTHGRPSPHGRLAKP